MKHRSPVAVILLSIITFGIYSLVWQVKTKNEMKRLGADIPTAWLLIIPIVGYYWTWKYAQGVEKVTNKEMSGVLAFVLLFLLSVIGMAILQSEFNKVSGQPVATAAAPPANPGNQWSAQPIQASSQPTQPLPDNSFGGPVAPAAASPQTASQTTFAQPVQPVAAPQTDDSISIQPTVVQPADNPALGNIAATPSSDSDSSNQPESPDQTPPQIQ